MQNAQELYATIRHLPPSERLRLAALILDDLAQDVEAQGERAARDQRGAKDLEIINQFADDLNQEALDVLSYQVEL
jgi:hypothetical protein